MTQVKLPFTSHTCINLHIFVHGMEQLYLLCSTHIKKLIQNVYNSYYYILCIWFHYKILQCNPPFKVSLGNSGLEGLNFAKCKMMEF